MPKLVFIDPVGHKNHLYRAFLVNLIIAVFADQVAMGSVTYTSTMKWVDELGRMHRDRYADAYREDNPRAWQRESWLRLHVNSQRSLKENFVQIFKYYQKLGKCDQDDVFVALKTFHLNIFPGLEALTNILSLKNIKSLDLEDMQMCSSYFGVRINFYNRADNTSFTLVPENGVVAEVIFNMHHVNGQYYGGSYDSSLEGDALRVATELQQLVGNFFESDVRQYSGYPEALLAVIHAAENLMLASQANNEDADEKKKKSRHRKSNAKKKQELFQEIQRIRKDEKSTTEELIAAINKCEELSTSPAHKMNVLCERGIINAILFQRDNYSPDAQEVGVAFRDNAIQALTEVEKNAPSYEVYYWLIQLYKLTWKRTQFSLDNSNSMAKKEKDDLTKSLHNALLAIKNYGMIACKKTTSPQETEEISWELASLFEYLKCYEQAYKVYSEVFAVNLERAQLARVKMAAMQYKLENYDESMRSFQSMLDDSQFDFRLYSKTNLCYSMSFVAKKMNDIPKAIELCHLAMEHETAVPSYDIAKYPLVIRNGFPTSEGLYPTFLIKADNTFYFYDQRTNIKTDLGDIEKLLNEYGVIFGAEGLGYEICQYYPDLYQHICIKHGGTVPSWNACTSRTLLAEVTRLNQIRFEKEWELMLAAKAQGNTAEAIKHSNVARQINPDEARKRFYAEKNTSTFTFSSTAVSVARPQSGRLPSPP